MKRKVERWGENDDEEEKEEETSAVAMAPVRVNTAASFSFPSLDNC